MKKLAILMIALLGCAWAQQPQKQGAPDYAANSRYVQGYGGGGYAPSCTSATGVCPGSDLVLHIAAGTSDCNNAGTVSKADYAGGTLTVTNSTTNYVSVAPCTSATPIQSTSAFSHVPLYSVVASGGVIQSISEARSPFAESLIPTTLIHAIPFSIYNPSGLTATTGIASTDYTPVPFGCTITGYQLAIETGTITVKFWRKASGTAIPTSSDSISTSGVGISTGTRIVSSTVSDFTSTTINADDLLAMNVTAVSGGATYVTGILKCQ